jgi:hypothetical protein
MDDECGNFTFPLVLKPSETVVFAIVSALVKRLRNVSDDERFVGE